MSLANRLRGLLHWDRKVTRLVGRGARAAGRGGRLVDRRRHRGAGLRLLLLVGTGALAGLCPSLRAARQRLDGDADRRGRPHQRGRGLRDRRRRALRRRPGGAGAGRRRRGGDRARSRPGGSANPGPRAAPSAAPDAFRRRCGGCSRRRLRSRRDRRQRHRLPLRGGDGGRAAPAGRGRPQHAGRAEARLPRRHGPLPGPLLRRRRGAHDDRRGRRIRAVRAAAAGQAGAHPCALGRAAGMDRPQGFRAARHGAAARDRAVARRDGRYAG